MSKWSTKGILPGYLLKPISLWEMNAYYLSARTHIKPHLIEMWVHNQVFTIYMGNRRKYSTVHGMYQRGYNENHLIITHTFTSTCLMYIISKHRVKYGPFQSLVCNYGLSILMEKMLVNMCFLIINYISLKLWRPLKTECSILYSLNKSQMVRA
jgi:hypothetical protein